MFDVWYENWWFEHDVDKPAMSPKEAMRQAWEAGRKAQTAAQQTLALDVADGRPYCSVCNGYHFPPPREGHFPPQRQ